jgi:hypothetical protein
VNHEEREWREDVYGVLLGLYTLLFDETFDAKGKDAQEAAEIRAALDKRLNRMQEIIYGGDQRA